MADPTKSDKPGGALGYLRELLNSPERMEKRGCVLGGAVFAVAIIFLLIWAAATAMDGDETARTNPEPPPAQNTPAPAQRTVENPTAVGQAVDAIAQPALAEVYGEAVLAGAPPREALIVSLSYDIPANPAQGDGERVRDAFLSRGATVDPDNSEFDYHAGEEFMVSIDTGNPAFKTVRVLVNPDSTTVYVNADKSE
jgi:hypothetical protein